MNIIQEITEDLAAQGLTQCDYCKAWGEGMNINEDDGLMACSSCGVSFNA